MRNQFRDSFNKVKLFGLDSKRVRWDFGGGEEETKTTSSSTQTMTPVEYAESTAGRGTWWDQLQKDRASGSWGASMPDYNKVYENAANRINQHYWGGPSSGGVIDKLRASAARRGVEGSPAMGVLEQRAGAEQAGQLGKISTDLDVTKAEAIERARTNWLQSIQNLSSLKSGGYTSTGNSTQTQTTPQESMLPALIGAGVGLAGNYMTGNWMSGLMKSGAQPSMPQTTQSSIGRAGGGAYSLPMVGYS